MTTPAWTRHYASTGLSEQTVPVTLNTRLHGEPPEDPVRKFHIVDLAPNHAD